MPNCSKCKKDFKNKVLVGGKLTDVHTRKHCLDCLPYQKRKLNTNSINNNLKQCKQCSEYKNTIEFYSQQQIGPKGQIWKYFDCYCKECRGKYGNSRRKNIKKQCIEYLGGKCFDCGLIDDDCIYDFHHLNPKEKDFSLSDKSNKRFESLKKELDKCILLCAHCHRKRHVVLT